MNKLKLYFLFVVLTSCHDNIIQKKEYHPLDNTMVVSIASFKQGSSIRHGPTINFDLDGDTIEILNYKRDLLQGLQYYFDEDEGYLKFVRAFRKGKRNGLVTRYRADGSVFFECEFKQDRIMNVLQLTDSVGRGMNYGDLKDGDGMLLVRDANGAVMGFANFDNGIPVGHWGLITEYGDTVLSPLQGGLIDGQIRPTYYW